MVWMFLFLQIHMLILTPKVKVLKGGAFGRWLGYEGRALVNGFSALIEESRESSPAPFTTQGYSEKSEIDEEVGPHQTLNLSVQWSGISWPLEMWELNVCCL